MSKKTILSSALFDGFDFALKINYFEGIGKIMKQYGSFVADPAHVAYRHWRVRKTMIDSYVQDIYNSLIEANELGFVDDFDEFMAVIDAALEQPDMTLFIKDVHVKIYQIRNGGCISLSTYHPGIAKVCKEMGGRFMGIMKAWELLNTDPFVLKNNLQTSILLGDEQIEVMDGIYGLIEGALSISEVNPNDFDIGECAEPQLSKGKKQDEENAIYLPDISSITKTSFDKKDIEKCLSDYELYDYQHEGAWHLLKQNSALLADDMGLGKTRQAIVAADIIHRKSDGSKKILVICPASLVINWQREISMIDSDGIVAMQAWREDAKWIVTNYERLGYLMNHRSDFIVVLMDEAHMIKNPASGRTREVFDVASKIPNRFILTGTPILNRECEIHTLLALSGHPIGNIPLPQFEKEFTGNSEFRKRLNQEIGTWMLRRTKDVVLKSLQGKQRQFCYINTTTEEQEQYDAVLNDDSLLSLQKLQKLRQVLEKIKIKTVIEMILEMNKTDKVLVFCEFLSNVSDIKQRLENNNITCVTLTGSDNGIKRQKAIDEFQTNDNVRVFIGTTKAAGVGTTLTAANYVVFASLPWTDAQKEQAEDRAYRNGQKRLVIVKIPIVENTIDDQLWDLLKTKQGIAAEVLNDDSEQKSIVESIIKQNKALNTEK
jgi:SNF2 family DNA or RNA helicase